MKDKSTYAGTYQGVIITNHEPKKIKIKIVYDEKFKILRIDIKKKQTRSKKPFMGDYYE